LNASGLAGNGTLAFAGRKSAFAGEYVTPRAKNGKIFSKY
jgi:hypothetical protein